MNNQQECLLEMLKEIHAICVKHDINYFAMGGTLIGAVRNGGFLPWDDDADIMMPYDDWKRFEKACETDLPPNRHLGAADLDERYCHIVPRFVSKETTAIHTCQSLQDDVAGESIDIFILDPVSDEDGAYEDYLQDMFLYASVVNYANVAATHLEIDADRFRKYLALERDLGRSQVVERMEENLSRHFGEGKYYALRWQSMTLRCERSWYDHPVPLQFEDMQLFAPNGYCEYLTLFFGDDWPEVPKGITPSKHNAAFSHSFPYTDALEYYRPSNDRAEIKRLLDERKYLLLKHAKERNDIKDELMAFRARVESETVSLFAERHRDEVARARKERNGRELALLLEGYLREQTSRDYIGRNTYGGSYRVIRPVLIDVPEEIFEAGLIAMFYSDRLRFVGRLLDAWKKQKGGLASGAQKIEDDLALFHDAAHCFEVGAFGDAARSAQKLLIDYPDCLIFAKLECMSLYRAYLESKEQCDFDKLKKSVDYYSGVWPQDGFFAKYEADFLSWSGDEVQARDLYLRAAESTRNGIVLNEIAELTGYHPSWLRTPEWAREAGVAQWDGEDAEPLPASGDVPALPTLGDPRQEYLVGLLAELARLCADHQIRCALSPAMARCMSNGGPLPTDMDAYAIWLEPGEHAKLRAVLQSRALEDRRFGYMGNTPTFKDRIIRFYGLDSFFCRIDGGGPSDSDKLFVKAIPLEPVTYPKLFRRALYQWDRGKRSASRIVRVFDGFYRLLHGLTGDEKRIATRLFDLAMNHAESVSSRGEPMQADGIAVDVSLLKELSSFEYMCAEFAVPASLDEYCALAPATDVGYWLSFPEHFTFFAGHDYSYFVNNGALSPDLFERRSALRQELASAKEASRLFKRNFKEIKVAVGLKELALQLLPQKERIVELYESQDHEQLRSLLEDYLAYAEKYPKAGDTLSFDDDIYHVMCAVRQ